MATKDIRKANELLIVTKNELGTLAKITLPLAKNRINIECYTGYEWGGEAAFRFVTDNNKKAKELLSSQGFTVQENPVVLWETNNTPGTLYTATTALAEARINTYCSYSAAIPGTKDVVAVLNTSNVDRTVDVLKKIR